MSWILNWFSKFISSSFSTLSYIKIIPNRVLEQKRLYKYGLDILKNLLYSGRKLERMVLLRVEKSAFNRWIIVAVRRDSIAGMHYCGYVPSFVTGVDRNVDLPAPERIRRPANPSFVHTNPHCWSEHVKCAVSRAASIRNRVMNLFSFVGAIAFCPEFARRNGPTAFPRMDVAWKRARERIYVHSIYIGHMPISTTRQNSVHFVNLAPTNFTPADIPGYTVKKFRGGEKYLRCLKLSRDEVDHVAINLPFPQVYIIIFNAANQSAIRK